MHEIIARARTADEEAAIEAALADAGIEYSIGLDAAPDATEGAVCFLARTYSVDSKDACQARAVLATK